MTRLALTLTVLLALKPCFLTAQDKLGLPNVTLLDVQPGERGVPESAKLTIYKPKFLPVAEAAELVKGLMGQSVSVLAEHTSNSLLIRGSESQLQEMKAVLAALDQPPKLIAFEVMIADLPASVDNSQPAKKSETSEEAWLARLKSPEGKITGNISKLRLTAIDNQTAMVQFGEQTPVVTGVQQALGGRGAERSPVIQQKQTGTIVKCTARAQENGTIVAELEIERSRLAPEGGTLLEEESDDRGTLRAPGQLTTTCKTTVTLKPGKPRVISGLKSQVGNGSTLSVIVITAELVTEE